MVMTQLYTSDESLARQQEAARMRQREKEQDDGFMKGAIIDADYQEVDVSATGDVQLLPLKIEKKP